MLGFLKSGAAWAGLVLAFSVPVGVLAQTVQLPAPTLTAAAGAFGGKWVYRSYSNSGKSADTLAKLALGQSVLTLTEANGKVTGTRVGQGTTYELAGTALYAPKQGATIRLHGTGTVGAKTYNYDYFGYLVPAWTVATNGVSDTIMGTVLRSDPTNPANAPVIAAFSATRQK